MVSSLAALRLRCRATLRGFRRRVLLAIGKRGCRRPPGGARAERPPAGRPRDRQRAPRALGVYQSTADPMIYAAASEAARATAAGGATAASTARRAGSRWKRRKNGSL